MDGTGTDEGGISARQLSAPQFGRRGWRCEVAAVGKRSSWLRAFFPSFSMGMGSFASLHILSVEASLLFFWWGGKKDWTRPIGRVLPGWMPLLLPPAFLASLPPSPLRCLHVRTPYFPLQFFLFFAFGWRDAFLPVTELVPLGKCPLHTFRWRLPIT